jgi:hypothetical protein
MRIVMAGAAAIALAASGAFAQGNGKGNGQGNGGNKPAAAQSKGNGNGGGNGNGRADRGNGKAQSPVQLRAERQVAQRGNNGNQGNNRGNSGGNGNGNAGSKQADRSAGRGVGQTDRRDVRVRYDDRGNGGDAGRIIRDGLDYRWLAQDRSRSLIEGCPPGLAKKRNGCNPPGQVRDRYERNLFGYNYRPSLFGLSNYDRGDYYYNDGYLVRYGDSGISGWIPLLGGALGIGNAWPSGYRSYEVPDYYVDYYNLGGPDRYRYADNVIYRVNPEDSAITSIAALITGSEFSVGQPMPAGYDVYNVPYGYRDRYYDTPEYMYRYSDGYVYQVDPETRLVAAAIDLLI